MLSRAPNYARLICAVARSAAVLLHELRVEAYMRIITGIACCTMLMATVASADTSSSESERLAQATAVLQKRATTPEHEIPTDTANRAACVIVFPSVKKAAFIVGGEYGKGVLTCRDSQGWSAPAFVKLEKGSVGFQAGAEEIDLVLLVMNRKGVDRLLQDEVTLGAGMSIAGGPVGGTASASTDAQFRAEILSYSLSRGAFIGADLSGGVLGPDTDANRHVYGSTSTARDIIEGHGTASPAGAQEFLTAVRQEFGGVRANASH
jgi:SH3 domain-containing YSC84-like protein 1